MLAPRDDITLSTSIHRFIREDEGADIGRLTDLLRTVGSVAIFGGMPRDFARTGGSANFRSDVDLVVEASPYALSHALQSFGVKRNRFGGCRFRLGRFDFDVWALENTWAVAEGHVPVRSLSDLTKTTFFDCDAVVYHCDSGAISRTPSFWTNLRERRIGINLQFNPHPVGTLARTLRALLDWQLDLSPELIDYLLTGLTQHGSEVERYTRVNIQYYRFARVLDVPYTIDRLSGKGARQPQDFGEAVAQLRSALNSEVVLQAV